MKCVQSKDVLFQTRSVSKTTSPAWNENFECFVDNPFKLVAFQVKSSKTSSNAE